MRCPLQQKHREDPLSVLVNLMALVSAPCIVGARRAINQPQTEPSVVFIGQDKLKIDRSRSM